MTLPLLILIASAITMLLSIAAALRIPSWSYRLTGVLAIAMFISAWHQVKTNQGAWLILLWASLLNAIMLYRFVAYRRHLPNS